MKFTVNAPEYDLKVSVPGWAVAFCAELGKTAFVGGALIHYFNYWDSVKVTMMRKQIQENEELVKRGMPEKHIINRLQFHTMPAMVEELLGMASEKTILKARKFLESKDVLSKHENPNKQWAAMDRKIYYLFNPEPLRIFIADIYINSDPYRKITASYRTITAPYGKNAASYSKSAVSTCKSAATITTTPTTTTTPTPTTNHLNHVAGATEEKIKKEIKDEKQSPVWMALEKRIGKCQCDLFRKNEFEFPFTKEFKKAFIEWLEYKRKVRSVYKSPNSIKKLLKQFGKMNEAYSIELIDNAIAQNYVGVIFKNTINHFQKQKNNHGKSAGSNSDKHAQVAANLGAILNTESTTGSSAANFAQ